MELSKGTKAALWVGSICLIHVVGMLAFRAFIYAGMYKATDDPYGVSDIIELFLACLFLFFLVLSVFLSLALFFKGVMQSKKSAVFLVVFCIFLIISYPPLRQLAAGWGS